MVTTLSCAVLDDYQGVAHELGDWKRLDGRVDVRFVDRHIPGHDELVAEIADCEIVVVMRERTPFPAELFARLPKLRLLITSGMRNASVDLGAAAAHGVTVCGTASNSEPPAELTWALILGLARGVVTEGAHFRDGGPWQSTLGADLHGRRGGGVGGAGAGGRRGTRGRTQGSRAGRAGAGGAR
ncbi:D-2-hydroxyacid dehydrogenase family protein, partial [Streptomyces sp. NPDC059524]